MSRAKMIVLRFSSFGVSGQTFVLANGLEPFGTSGDQFVGVSLVADIPDKAVLSEIKKVVQSESQFDRAKVGCKMSAGLGDCRDYLLTYLGGKFNQFFLGELFEIDRGMDLRQMFHGCAKIRLLLPMSNKSGQKG